MTKPTPRPTRCERILAVIDACLADVDPVTAAVPAPTNAAAGHGVAA